MRCQQHMIFPNIPTVQVLPLLIVGSQDGQHCTQGSRSNRGRRPCTFLLLPPDSPADQTQHPPGPHLSSPDDTDSDSNDGNCTSSRACTAGLVSASAASAASAGSAAPPPPTYALTGPPVALYCASPSWESPNKAYQINAHAFFPSTIG